MEFMVGCNYWASHAGTNMWTDWNEDIVRSDLKLLAEHNVQYLRVFPNWADFQPVKPLDTMNHKLYEYRMMDDSLPTNPYYIDETMLDRFEIFCDIAQEYNIKFVVGVLTGWMSGRLYIPPALYNKNVYTDPVALLFEQLFIKGFVERFKDHPAIHAWDLGNEVNCMDVAETAVISSQWTAMLANAIRAVDNTRLIISGMHSVRVENNWRIQDQGLWTDMLTTHPYPQWVPYAYTDRLDSIRTLHHATCETEYYASISGKPCLVEEIGSMGPIASDDKTAGDFMRLNLYSNWANGASGLMWWCAHDQTMLDHAPYSWNMIERELGLTYADMTPKPALIEMKKFVDTVEGLGIELPKHKPDAVCISTRDQEQWGIGYMSYILAKQAGANITFTYCEQDLPESDVYLIPSIDSYHVMPKHNYDLLKQRVYDGATVYISMNNSVITEFEEFAGMRLMNREFAKDSGVFTLDGQEITYKREAKFTLSPAGAEVLAYDETGNPIFTVHNYGKGKVFYLNFPLEETLLDQHEAFANNNYRIYETVFCDTLNKKAVVTNNPSISMTEHYNSNTAYIVMINYSNTTQATELTLQNGWTLKQTLLGDMDSIPGCDCTILELQK